MADNAPTHPGHYRHSPTSDAVGDLLQMDADNKASCPALAGDDRRTFGALADASDGRQASERDPARRFVIDRMVAAIEPTIRADERRVCAELVRGWLPRRQAFDSSFEDAMAGLAEKIEARQ